MYEDITCECCGEAFRSRDIPTPTRCGGCEQCPRSYTHHAMQEQERTYIECDNALTEFIWEGLVIPPHERTKLFQLLAAQNTALAVRSIMKRTIELETSAMWKEWTS